MNHQSSDIFRKLQKPTLERNVAGGAGLEGWPQYILECENAMCPAWLDISRVMAPATNNDNDRAPATPSHRHHRRQISKSLECWNAASGVVCCVNLLIVAKLTWETGAGGSRAWGGN